MNRKGSKSMVSRETTLDRAETHESRILREMEAAAAAAWRASTTGCQYAACPGYLRLHHGVNGTIDAYLCPTCDVEGGARRA